MTVTVRHESGTRYTFRIPRDADGRLVRSREEVLDDYAQMEWFVVR